MTSANCMNTLIDPFLGCNNKPVPTEDLKQWLSAYEKKEQYEYCEIILTEIKRRQNENKSIIQLDLDGNYIEEYKSAVIASQYIGIHPSGITSVLKGTQKTAGGFKWKYSN